MKRYRVYKLDEASGRILTGKDVLTDTDGEAMRAAEHDPDCPVCEVWESTRKVGLID